MMNKVDCIWFKNWIVGTWKTTNIRFQLQWNVCSLLASLQTNQITRLPQTNYCCIHDSHCSSDNTGAEFITKRRRIPSYVKSAYTQHKNNTCLYTHNTKVLQIMKHTLNILCVLDRASSWYLNKGWPTRWHLLYYILLNVFQTLIRPSSGASEYLLCCVGWLEACWCYVPGLSVGDVVSECRLNQPTLQPTDNPGT